MIRGRARFESAAVLLVDDSTRIEATRIVIATGAVPAVPDDFKIFGDRLITSDDVFELKSLPARCAVFGAGPIALELGQALARLGTEVFMFGQKNRVAALTDAPVRDHVDRIPSARVLFRPQRDDPG